MRLTKRDFRAREVVVRRGAGEQGVLAASMGVHSVPPPNVVYIAPLQVLNPLVECSIQVICNGFLQNIFLLEAVM